MTPDERARVASASVVNADAYDAFLRGMQYYYRLTSSELDIAEDYFEAIDLDENSVFAYVGLAKVWAGRQQMGFTSPDEAGPRAKEYALVASTLDDQNAEAHHALASVRTWTEWDFELGEESFRRAIELKPNFPDARAFYAHYLSVLGRTAEAIEQMERAVELDPLNPLFRSLYGVVLNMARRPDEAIAQAEWALRVSPNQPLALLAKSEGLFMTGRYAELLAVESALAQLLGDGAPAIARQRSDDAAVFIDGIRALADWTAEQSRASGTNALGAASLFAYAGDTEGSIEWIERAFEQRDPNVLYLRAPVFDAVRDDPRVQAVMGAIGLL